LSTLQVAFIQFRIPNAELCVMDDTEQIAWIARRLTFGSGLVALPELVANGRDAALETLLAPTDEPTSPWAGVDIPDDISLDDSILTINAWLDRLAGSSTPLSDWTTWFWHDHFAVSAPQIRSLSVFTRHIDLLAELGGDGFAQLLHAVTIDPAMLIFLDGRRNRIGAVNENYGRELLELYALGVGNYDEADVRAAAVALTGWTLTTELDGSRFAPRRHDDTPQQLLGSTVDDLDSVIDAVTGHPACAEHVTRHMAEAMLGTALPEDDVRTVADRFRASALNIGVLRNDLLDLALAGAAEPIVLPPVQWFLHAEAVTAAQIEPRQRLFALRQMGQVPGVPPNVGGYPDALTWAGPSTTVGRFRAASLIAGRTDDDAELLDRARRRDWTGVAELTGRTNGFSAETLRALDDANTTRRNGREALAAVLMSPELAVA